MKLSSFANFAAGSIVLSATAIIGVSAHSDYSEYTQRKLGIEVVTLTQEMLGFTTRMSMERGPNNGVLGSPLPIPQERLKALTGARSATDNAASAAETSASALPSEARAIVVRSVEDARRKMADGRRLSDGIAARPLEQRSARDITAAIDTMIAAIGELREGFNTAELIIGKAEPLLVNWIVIGRSAAELRDYAGQVGSIFTGALVGSKPLSADELARYERLNGRIDALVHQLTEAQRKLGNDPELEAALAQIKERYLSKGRAIAANIVELSMAGKPYGMTVAEFANVYVPEITTIVAFRERAMARAKAVISARAESAWKALMAKAVVSVLILTVIAGIAAAFIFKVTKPLVRLTECMRQLAGGDTAVAIPVHKEANELGDMAAAVTVFRDNALRNIELQREAEVARERAEAERLQATRDAIAQERALVSQSIGRCMARLAAKDLSVRLDERLPEAYTDLQHNLNHALGELDIALQSVSNGSSIILDRTDEIANAADNLSRRTEQQAASVEQSAAALDQITQASRNAATQATSARELVGNARVGAEHAGQIVRETIHAMASIEKSAEKISYITNVIDEIAFQTNLLALNAGVEAARAGDSGRGFAVVASEVRGLAQRSADAAKEIKALIATSTTQVEAGVKLVNNTGVALERIVVQVEDISKMVVTIASGAESQADGLGEINVAINEIDRVTQQNAAISEETTAACGDLADQSRNLTALMKQFVLSKGSSERYGASGSGRNYEHKSAA